MGAKDDKAEEFLKNAVAQYINTESNRTTLITVTSTRLSKDWARCTVLVTVFPDDKTKGALDFLNRKKDDVRAYVKDKVKLRRIPYFEFDLDVGEKHRQHMDELFNAEEER
jgi:ribosome-binding factor A